MDLTVTIVRHGNTFDNSAPARRIGARTDLPLGDSGRAQAVALGAAFRARRLIFDRAFAAPLLRTSETCDLILAGQTRSTATETVDWLTEIDHGPDEGRLESEVVGRLGASVLAAWDIHAIPPEGWIVDEQRRVAGWSNLWDTGHGRILIVTSNGAARFALRSDAGLRKQAARLTSLKLRTGAYGTVARAQGRMRLVAWDCRP